MSEQFATQRVFLKHLALATDKEKVTSVRPCIVSTTDRYPCYAAKTEQHSPHTELTSTAAWTVFVYSINVWWGTKKSSFITAKLADT